MDFRIILDFEKTQGFYVKYKHDGEAHWRTCFRGNGLKSFVDHRHAYLQMFASTGKKYTFSIAMHEFLVYEKLHRLDIEERMAVKHEISQEIFDKLIYFTEEINDDKVNLEVMHLNYRRLNSKVKLFEHYIHDLYRGIRHLETHIRESLRRVESLTPDSFPKMKKIRQLVASLETKQKKIYDRFSDIKGILNARKVFQNMKTALLKMEGVVLQLNEQIGSDAYQTFFGKTSKMMELLQVMDFGKMTEDVNAKIKVLTDRANGDHANNLAGLVAFTAVISVLCYLVFKSIASAETQSK